MRFILGLFICLLGFLYPLIGLSQEEYDSAEDLVNDIKNRNFEKPIAFMERTLFQMENDSTEEFQDSIYISMTSLLTSSYIESNQPYSADSLLSHSINFLVQSRKKSKLAYILFLGYGGLLAHLGNYSLAKSYLYPVVDFLNKEGEYNENYAIALSMLAICHNEMDSLELAVKEIDEAIKMIDTFDSYFTMQNKSGIYQKAGCIYEKAGILEKAEEFTKRAYDITKNKLNSTSEYINSAQDLATIYLNHRKYVESLEILKELEKEPLSEKEKIGLYNSLFLVYYFLNNKEETVKYADLCSQVIRNSISLYHSSFPTATIEEFWEKYAMQLNVNNGILDRFPSDSTAICMCYDNVLFNKNLSFATSKYLRDVTHKDNEIKETAYKLQQIKTQRFIGSEISYKELDQLEKKLIHQIQDSEYHFSYASLTWQDIKRSLSKDEIAIEIITYVGFPESEEDNKVLRYGALILSNEMTAPVMVDICSFQDLSDLMYNALVEQEYGINQLYLKEKDTTLYNLTWKNIEPFILGAKTIYISPQLNFQNINLLYIPCPDNKYISEKYDIRIVSSTSALCKKQKEIEFSDIALFGGIKYTKNSNEPETSIGGKNLLRGIVLNDFIDKTRGSYGYLRATDIEVDSIYYIMSSHSYKPQMYKGGAADERSFREFDGNAPSIIHLATHGYYLWGFGAHNDYFSKLRPNLDNDYAMLYSGLLLANGSTSLNEPIDNNALCDGVLTAEEISWFDLNKTKLVVLSACDSAIGSATKEGIGGLLKAFKNAGVEHIIASLWKVPDEATSKLMIAFYKQLASGTDIHKALNKAQEEVFRQYPDPFYWAAFILID